MILFFSSTGPLLTSYGIDSDTATAQRHGAISLPANVQYAWPHPFRNILYVAASNAQPPGGPRLPTGPDKNHYAIAYHIAPRDGALTPLGEPALLGARPIHLSVDHDGRFLLVAYNNPSQVTVHRLAPDGTIGPQVPQSADLDFGIYAHQVLATPSNSTVTLVTRGNDATTTQPEDSGAIKVFGFTDGVLSNRASIAPGNGLGFGPRHLDFHPQKPLVYVSIERQNAIFVYGLTSDGSLTPEPLHKRAALAADMVSFMGQMAGPIHVHPNGRFVYQANRNSQTRAVGTRDVWIGGENSIVVWAIDEGTGEPTEIQRVDTLGFEPRTFAIDPTGRLLVVANIASLPVERDRVITDVPASFSLFRIETNGKLTFARKYDVNTSHGTQLWSSLFATT